MIFVIKFIVFLEKWDIKYLDITYSERDDAKSKAAKWDNKLKTLCITYKSNKHVNFF